MFREKGQEGERKDEKQLPLTSPPIGDLACRNESGDLCFAGQCPAEPRQSGLCLPFQHVLQLSDE